jgi:hypothetical protein
MRKIMLILRKVFLRKTSAFYTPVFLLPSARNETGAPEQDDKSTAKRTRRPDTATEHAYKHTGTRTKKESVLHGRALSLTTVSSFSAETARFKALRFKNLLYVILLHVILLYVIS